MQMYSKYIQMEKIIFCIKLQWILINIVLNKSFSYYFQMLYLTDQTFHPF